MNRKPGKLERLLTIRQLQEEVGRCALQGLFASVTEVETSIETQREAFVEAGQQARDALTAGSREQWLMASARRGVSQSNKGRLSLLLDARRASLKPAMKQFLESRREREEVNLLVEDAKRDATTNEVRRLQAAADEWFLGRIAASRKKAPRSP